MAEHMLTTTLMAMKRMPDCFIRDFINFYERNALTEIVHGMR